MFFYNHYNKILVSKVQYNRLHEISEQEAKITDSTIYFLTQMPPLLSKRSFCISYPSLLFLERESIDLLRADIPSRFIILPQWILDKINSREAASLNLSYPLWEDVLKKSIPQKWKINIAGLGDVGGILLSGLKLLGRDYISQIGIFDIDRNRITRWLYESNQILPPESKSSEPHVNEVSFDEIFDCDMFLFCVTAGVPPVGDEDCDVRLVQFEKNSNIIKQYSKKARQYGFKGIFGVISDPVDHLCKVVFESSNINESGEFDFKGLAAEQIKGFGLGVMYARAAYYASQSEGTRNFLSEGRVFGPHGEGLIVANSIANYDDALSIELTEKTKRANLDIRALGYKPYIAPALSSGALSVIAAIKGEWHYSSTFIGGAYMGARNRITPSGTELERLNLPECLFKRIENTFKGLCRKNE